MPRHPLVGSLTVLAALTSAGGDDDHARKRASHQGNPDSYPLSDRDYLEEECRRNLRGHLRDDHGSVGSLAMRHVHPISTPSRLYLSVAGRGANGEAGGEREPVIRWGDRACV